MTYQEFLKTKELKAESCGFEEWRQITEFPNYEVSNLGNVRSKDRVVLRRGYRTNLKGKMLLQHNVKGYKRVVLYDGSREIHKQYMVHRLVAEAFIPNPNNEPCVNHKDENGSNNRVDNLEWCSYKYNSNYGTAIERRVKHQDWNSIAEKQSIRIEQMDTNGNLIKIWPSMMECERQTGMRSAGISKCCSGYLKSYRGYIWRKVV